MNQCIICSNDIDNKYEMCWSCLQKLKKNETTHLTTLTCTNCKLSMYSMEWPGNLCCSCYSYSQAKKRGENV